MWINARSIDQDQRVLRCTGGDERGEIAGAIADRHGAIEMRRESLEPGDGAGTRGVGGDERRAAVGKARMRGEFGADRGLARTWRSGEQESFRLRDIYGLQLYASVQRCRKREGHVCELCLCGRL